MASMASNRLSCPAMNWSRSVRSPCIVLTVWRAFSSWKATEMPPCSTCVPLMRYAVLFLWERHRWEQSINDSYSGSLAVILLPVSHSK